MRSIPKILIRIKREKAWLGNFAANEGLDLVISDNRYGLTTPGIPCIFMTHQLLIKTPFGRWADRMLQTLNYRAIRHFSRCWIPDTAPGGLAGELSHPQRMPPIPASYIGLLSRFKAANAGEGRDERAGLATPGYLLVLLSGPEPQRTLFESDILRQAMAMDKTAPGCRLVIVRGLPGGGEAPLGLPGEGKPLPALPPWITLYDHLPSRALEPLLLDARLVLSRPGYSTVMDLERLGKRALLVPTPGQTEQEYLGPYLAGKGWADCVDQRAFSLAKAFEMALAGGSARERQPEDPGLLAAEISAVLLQSSRPALG